MNLAYSLRPQTLSDFYGQHHLVDKGKIIERMIEKDQLFSMILWGPPGSGKTTLASIIAKETKAHFHQLSGVTSGKADLGEIIRIARSDDLNNVRTILFIDEIHRWNKAQQDALLPHVETGLIILIGATTENPSFEVINALLSRSRVLVLDKHGSEALVRLMERALAEAEKYFGKKVAASKEALEFIASVSGGDARQALGTLEEIGRAH